jgi:8-oxo-dGTP pyrophosphatase MutT (NUDIX family)
MTKQPVRVSARVVLIDARDRVLLVQHPVMSPTESFDSVWVPAGGGVEPGESLEDTAVRELLEETGCDDVRLGPLLWLRSGVFNFNGNAQAFEEHFFLGRVDAFELVVHTNSDADEIISAFRWWTLDEIATSSEVFAPRNLAHLLGPILAGEVPSEPIIVI